MADVRIAQIGQTAVNQPFVEIAYGTQRFVFLVDENNRIVFKNRAFLQSMGVNSLVCKQYADKPSDGLIRLLKMDAQNSADRPSWFAAQTYGTGYALNPDFDPRMGFKSLYPTGALVYQL